MVGGEGRGCGLGFGRWARKVLVVGLGEEDGESLINGECKLMYGIPFHC